MVLKKACKKCKTIYEGEKCPSCESTEFVDGFKGRVVVIKPEESEIAKKVGIIKSGNYAIKTK